jgi:uncharacterized protein YecT (DUF1311 family)
MRFSLDQQAASRSIQPSKSSVRSASSLEKTMRKQYLLLATLIVTVCNILPLTAIAQESNCSKEPSTAEQYQCANHELAIAEQDLENAFTGALQRYTPKADDMKENALPPPERDQQADYERRMRQRLQLSQKIWLQYQSAACAAVSDFYEGGTMGPTAATLCKAEIAKQRAKFLRDNFEVDVTTSK